MDEWIPLGIAAAVVLGLLLIGARALSSSGGSGPTAPARPFSKRPLLNKSEQAFYHALCQAADKQWLVLAKSPLAAVLDAAEGIADRDNVLNQLRSETFDFLVCRSDNLEPLLAIQLDAPPPADGAAEQDQPQPPTNFRSAACAAAGLPLLRLRPDHAYTAADLKRAVRRALDPPSQAA
jgi:hypothetical protein